MLDLGSELTDSNLEAIRLSDAAIIVARLDVPAIRLTRRLIEELGQQQVSASKLQVVFNRYGERGQLDAASAERALGLKPVAWLADDPRLVNSARNRGVPLEAVARSSRLGRQLGGLAETFAPARS